MSTYNDYVADNQFLVRYNAYQERYASQIPERDKITINLVADLAKGRHVKVLDVGCSTGNLLLHFKRLLRNVDLFGGDLAQSSIEIAQKIPELVDVTISNMDMLDIHGNYDFIVSNAVTYLFTDEQFKMAATSVYSSLNPGGVWVDFDWFSPFSDQRVTINEVTPSHPGGIDIHVRAYNQVANTLKRVGFTSVEFKPFEIPISLPLQSFEGDPITYTVPTADGRHLQFRGVLFQPWCHLVAIREI